MLYARMVGEAQTAVRARSGIKAIGTITSGSSSNGAVTSSFGRYIIFQSQSRFVTVFVYCFIFP